jgi:hypothetical protein
MGSRGKPLKPLLPRLLGYPGEIHEAVDIAQVIGGEAGEQRKWRSGAIPEFSGFCRHELGAEAARKG